MTRAEAKLVLDSLTTWEGEERMITAEIVEAIRVLSQEPHLSNDLEEAAEEYRRESYSKSVLPNIDGPMPEYGGGIKDAFIAGAEWQKSQKTRGTSVVLSSEDFQALIDSHARRVEADYKEKMLKDAVEGEICGRVYDHINVRFADGVCKYLEPKNISHIPADVSKYNIGDKVRIVVLKEEEE